MSYGEVTGIIDYDKEAKSIRQLDYRAPGAIYIEIMIFLPHGI